MACSDPAKIPPVMVAVRAESVMAILVIGVANAAAVIRCLGSACSEVAVVVLGVLVADCLIGCVE